MASPIALALLGRIAYDDGLTRRCVPAYTLRLATYALAFSPLRALDSDTPSLDATCVSLGTSSAMVLGCRRLPTESENETMNRNRKAWRNLNAILAQCGYERIAYETARVASGRHVSMKWLAAARYKAEAAGFSLEEIDRAEAVALAERGQ